MKLCVVGDFPFSAITNHSEECDENTAFLLTNLSRKYLSLAKAKTPHIIESNDLFTYISLTGIKIIGITGTNGKSTVASMIGFALHSLGSSVATLGTLGFFINEQQVFKNANTTPDTLELYSYILQAREAQCEYFVMEVSSHAIAQNRIAGLEFTAKIITNITQDHLDFHKNIEEYRAVKNAFLQDSGCMIANGDDENIEIGQSICTYGTQKSAFLQAQANSSSSNIQATLVLGHEKCEFSSPLIGNFNLSNFLASILCIQQITDHSLAKISKILEDFRGIPGRMEVVSRNPLVIVDFAHTPDGMQKVLEVFAGKKICVLFGAGGNRDKAKRAIMGRVADTYAQKIYLTNDNPREEDEKKIIAGILAGITHKEKVTIISQRKEASKRALQYIVQESCDALLVLGKGSETTQEIKGTKLAYQDKQVIQKLLRENIEREKYL